MIELGEYSGDGGSPSTEEDVTFLPNMDLLVRQGKEIWAIELTYLCNSTKVRVFRYSSAYTSR